MDLSFSDRDWLSIVLAVLFLYRGIRDLYKGQEKIAVSKFFFHLETAVDKSSKKNYTTNKEGTVRQMVSALPALDQKE